MSITPYGRDLAIRTIYGEGEGEGPLGWAAIANVIKNRVDSGRWGGRDVGLANAIYARGQFTMWNPGNARGDMARRLSPNDPVYQRIGNVVDNVFTDDNNDFTAGATNYYAPSEMPGGQPPAWAAQGTNPRQIGNHAFLTLPLNQTGGAPPTPTTNVQPGYPVGYGPSGESTAGMNPAFVQRLTAGRNQLKSEGILTIQTEGFRSHEYQAALHAKLGIGAAPAGNSMHEQGLAADIYPANPDGTKMSESDPRFWPQMHRIDDVMESQAIGLQSGKNFKSGDFGHIQWAGGPPPPATDAAPVTTYQTGYLQPVGTAGASPLGNLPSYPSPAGQAMPASLPPAPPPITQPLNPWQNIDQDHGRT